MASNTGDADRNRILVWDWPTRATHWLIVASFALSWWSAKNHHMDWHYKSGMGMFGLIIFRLVWGLIGSTASRFRSFIRGPVAVVRYGRTLFRGTHAQHIGHNPLGGWSVVALLTALSIQVGLGLFAVDVDGLESGPLSWLVEFHTGRLAAEFHEMIFNVLLGLTVIHILAILFYLLVKRQNLVAAMITGYKWVGQLPKPFLRQARPWALIAGLAIAGGMTWAIWTGLPFLG